MATDLEGCAADFAVARRPLGLNDLIVDRNLGDTLSHPGQTSKVALNPRLPWLPIGTNPASQKVLS